LDQIAAQAGLQLDCSACCSLPVFVHRATGQEFVLVPAGSFVMGMTAAELVDALRKIGFDPDIKWWRDQHQKHYESANPAHSVAVQAFLCGRSPLLGRTISSAGLSWSTHQTAEHLGPLVAAAVTASDAHKVVQDLGWSLITEAQWEYVARCGGEQAWAENPSNIDLLVDDPRYTSDTRCRNSWGLWGLGLGEWIADEWHESYAGAPFDGSAWRTDTGLPRSIRGGSVLHAPWQDSGEEMSCHAAMRAGTGNWRKVFTVRPVISVQGQVTITPTPAPAFVSFDEVVAKLESELWEARTKQRQVIEARQARERDRRMKLPGSLQEGTIRSVGGNGVYILRLVDANAILKLPSENPRLVPGTKVTVCTVGTGGVPEAALVAIHE
jgi:hypothetical protein